MRRYTHLPAIFQNGTGGAMGQFARADVLSKRHYQTVDVNPFFSWAPFVPVLPLFAPVF